LNAFDCPYSNGFTEGINNTIKVIKRIAYGYRNFYNFRRRILHTLQTSKEPTTS
ncbi:MAG: transposase, partial [Clostridia bacterium]|nr:transposase [Clostridia bacterium]